MLNKLITENRNTSLLRFFLKRRYSIKSTTMGEKMFLVFGFPVPEYSIRVIFSTDGNIYYMYLWDAA